MSEHSLNRTSSHLFIVGRDCCGGMSCIPEADDLRRTSPVLRELLDGMAPLFTVLLNNSAIPEPSQSTGTTYYAVAPVLSSDGSFSTFAANATIPFRCSQQDVRGHILVQRHSTDHEGVVECMLDSAPVRFLSPPSSPESSGKCCRFPEVGCRVTVERSLGEVGTEVKEIRHVFSRDRMHCLVVLITAGSLVRRGDVDGASECGCSAPPSPLRERDGAAQGPEAASWLAGEPSEEGPPPGATSEVFTSSSPAHSEVALSHHRAIPSWYDCRHGRRSVSPTTRSSSGQTDEASSLRDILKATVVGTMVSSEVFDACLLSLDTDLAMFLSSYVCIDGYEEFIIARVNQIVESVVEHLLEELHAEHRAALEQRGTASTRGSSIIPRDRLQSVASDDAVSEDLRELIVVSFHTIVTARVAPFLNPHWRKVHHIEDYAFSHACRSLSRVCTVARCLRDSGVAVKCGVCPGPEIMVDTINMTAQLDAPRSVLETLRMMESIISCIVHATARFVTDVTADVCIPFLVYVLAHSQPVALPSTIRYVYSFMLGAYETTSLCYALTTFEAACTQLLHEYTSLVLSNYDSDNDAAVASRGQ